MEKQDKIDQLVAENQELLALTKQAFVKREVEKESVPVDEEWEKFAAEHADELEALEKDEPRTATIKKLMGIVPYKVAAGIIGILFTVGVAFAAIHIVRMVSHSKPQAMQAEQTISASLLRHYQQTPSKRTRQPTRSPLFSTMSHWIRCCHRLHHIITRKWSSRTKKPANSVSISYGNRTRRSTLCCIGSTSSRASP